ncbi:lipoate--protein ligase [Brevibacillus formosus]|uniref:lipoate--protein ligase n=1 Tax=Brevibacillus TaxID=55080 RepID=UPI000D0EEEB9|nr:MULTISPECIES: lipoate--protein ligase [Brevibacillus]MBG9941892.1 lipoate--protein ligase [Brevibacillus formosus]MBW5469540.1 lipoate--protein ligase [Brevibacillus formosus]MED1945602.1 lipoate--protein ligase [Brevibacillus formosus]MED2000765.1 lipoate--protein ligase [Brevibacillus formosus]MED2084389.1 lipoate--protein ligase [Brevibacillus formosus]
MKFIDNQGITDPRINLAIEEYALKHLPNSDDYLLFYINEPSIIIGKNQNTIEEINATYVEENHIHVVRRLSGGGAVYHDLGNLNFSFITNDDGESFHNFRKFTAPVVQALKTLGVEAELTGRNDIQVGERKISGNAQYSTKGRMFSHGTLLFDSEMENVVSALKVNAEKIQSKGIKSIRSRVANISEFLETKMTIEEFRQAILRSIFGEGEVEEYKLTEKDWENIHELSRSRYQTWEWNYGKSPKSNYRQSKRFDIGTVEIQLDIEKGKIKEAKIYGDFFGVRDVAELEAVLRDTPYDRSSVSERLAGINLQEFFGKLDQASFVDLLLV